GRPRLVAVELQLGGELETRLGLGGYQVRGPKHVATRARNGESRVHDQRSWAAGTAASTSGRRGGGGGASNVPSRTEAATCSCASRNGTPSRTSASAASVASRSGSAAAAASRSRSKRSPSTSTVSAPSAPRT